MRKIIINILSVFIFNKHRRHQFREKHICNVKVKYKQNGDAVILKDFNYSNYGNILLNNGIRFLGNNSISVGTIIGQHSYFNGFVIIEGKCRIGSFCSVGHRTLIGAGEHPIHYLSTSPFTYCKELNLHSKNIWNKNLTTIIGNDVWIGAHVVIKAGVTIGNGAIIGACAVVTKDVKPYSIVAGVPAKLIRYRFDEQIIKNLEDLQWWNLPIKYIKKMKTTNISEALEEIKNEKKMKIIFIIPDLSGGGGEKVVLNLSKLLRKNNYNSHIITFSNKIQHLIERDINIHYINLPKKTFLNSLFWKRICAKVVTNYIEMNIGEVKAVFSNLTFCDKIMKYSKLPVWHIIHSTTSIAEWGSKKGFSRIFAKIKTKRYYVNHPSICVSKGVLEDFKKNINNNAICIYNPIDKDNIIYLSEKEIPIQDKYLFNRDYIVAVGNIKRAKNYTLLIKAYAKSKIKENLIIIGNHADEYQKCLELIKKLNLSDKVFMIGFRANPYPYIKNAKLFILSSLYEGLPTVLLESISLGIPVISTDCKSGPSEILRNYKHCLVKVNDIEGFADKIKDAVNHPAKYIARLPEEMSDKDICKRYKELVCNE